jgi:hypothetical protein
MHISCIFLSSYFANVVSHILVKIQCYDKKLNSSHHAKKTSPLVTKNFELNFEMIYPK